MNKFAKYVPEEDKKKQREHIGAVGMNDLPFGEEVVDVSLQWDGDITNKLYRIYGFNYGVCLVYPNVTPSKEELVGHTFTYFKEGNEPITVTATLDALLDHYDNNDMGDICIGYRLFNRETDDIVLDVRTLPQDDIPTPGICLYFDTTTTTPGPDDEITGYFISSDYSFKQTVIKSIDPKYLQKGNAVVTITVDEEAGTVTANKTATEIADLFFSGVNIVAIDNYGTVYHLDEIYIDSAGSGGVRFHKLLWDYGISRGFTRLSWAGDSIYVDVAGDGMETLAMRSPNGTKFNVYVDDNGTLKVEAI